MALTNEEVLNLKISLKIDDWLLQTSFNNLESALAPFQVDNKKLWEEIQKNPTMSEKEFLKIVRKLKRDH